ncbi:MULTISPECIES: entericidin A/B family lipoprotein [Massilia]|jgi:entericidin A|uniref:Type IV secretion system putative lipoprotein virB7 n=3 Tax=Massilia TaxID=149698 RepID=A0ABX0M327_9BURK|nr:MULTISPECIES: entericidin A/B family lipoprotein [Massilia]NHZ36636.1 entericidin A/B family lipoprotein [Massilia rubra]NHZ40781.1 entericidin A/B family lipoprotein [Massilia aquatica]NHZ65113.1 entericidin A/B family lipoprotein [Massilia genomosp. 1]NHZ97315.1 entericidin A/B family lipoprotein [Massilia sp. CCM 8734]
MKKLFALFAIALLLAGCNTVSGFGKDIQKVGQKIDGAGKK